MFNSGISGRFDHTIDEKGRVSLPARFREALQQDQCESVFITNFSLAGERCLHVYPPAEWQRTIGKLHQRPTFSIEMQRFLTFFLGGAHEVPLDRQGRILIPPRLRAYASLNGEVTFSAMLNYYQLWNNATLEHLLTNVEDQVSDPQFMEKLGL